MRSLHSLGINQAIALAACAAGSLLGAQACGSDGSTNGGSAGTSIGGGAPGAGAPSSAGANPGNAGANPGNAGAPAAAGSSNAGSGGTVQAGGGASGAGTAGANTAGAAGMVVVAEGDSVLQRNNHASRDGHFLQPKLTKALIPTFTTDAGFAAKFTGNMWASPLFLANGPNGKGLFFAVTTSNDVYALDETSGAVIWTKNLGSPPTMNGVNCGNIHPLGILSTPVIDATTRTIYVAGANGTTAIDKHVVHAFNVDDGSERAGWPVDMTGLKSGAVTFAAPPQNQRSALSLVGGKLYVAYGGHIGDCGAYHGWVVAIDTANPTQKTGWATLGQGEAIWAAGGMASDGTSVFAVTGNSTVGVGNRANSDSEELVRVTGGALTRSNENLFFPTIWKQMDSQDADFGSSNPIYLSIPGSTPSNYVAALAKDGHLYLLNAANLGGMGGQVVDFTVANGGAMAVKTSPAAFTTAKGVHFVLSTDTGAQCPGGGGGKAVMSVLLKAGAPPTASVEWCAPLGGSTTGPIATTTDGATNAAVWYMNGGKLTAVDGDTGTKLYESTDNCSGIRQWTSPIAVKGRIIAGGDGHLCSWSAH